MDRDKTFFELADFFRVGGLFSSWRTFFELADTADFPGCLQMLVQLASKVQARLVSGRTGAPVQLAGEVQARSA